MRLASRIGPTLLSLLLLFAAAPPAGAADKPVVLKLASLAPEGSGWMKAFHAMNEEVIEKTGGAVRFKAYPGGVMGTDSVVFRKIRIGQVDGGSFTAGGASEIYPDAQILSLPLLFRDYDEVDRVMGTMAPLLTAGLEKKGFVVLTWAETGFVYLMSQSPVTSVEGLKGLKVWIPEGDPISRATFETAGVPPIPLPLPDVLTGIQTGLIDTYCNSPVGSIVLQWFTKVKYLTHTPLLYAYGVLMVSKKRFDKIPEEHRPVVKAIAAKHFAEINRQTRQDNVAAMETLKKEGIKILPVSDEEVQGLLRLAAEVKGKLVDGKVFSRELYQTLQSAIDACRRGQGNTGSTETSAP